ncbi:MAG TPA: GNAT family N-acetyltransferase [Acidimicrobiales bacterium]
MDLTIREMTAVDWAAAPGLDARAFADEPFAIGMFGRHRHERFIGLLRLNNPWPPLRDFQVGYVAVVEGVMVAMAAGRLAGHCRQCTEVDPGASVPEDPALAVDHEFDVAVHHAHARSVGVPHAHVGPVMTEPLLFGRGIGAQVMVPLMERLWAVGSSCVVLECVPARVTFYERCGFRVLDEFADPAGPSLTVCLMRADPPS